MSDVGGKRPIRDDRLEKADNPRTAATKGAKPSKNSPILVFTRFVVFSTIHSAKSCLTETLRVLRPDVRKRHRNRIPSITHQELTCDSVMGRSWIGSFTVKNTCAPVMSMPSDAGTNNILITIAAAKDKTDSKRKMMLILHPLLLFQYSHQLQLHRS